MGIGISFTGRDGATRTMQAESPAEVRSALELAMGQSAQAMGAVGARQSKRAQHVSNITNILNRIQKMTGGGGGGENPDEAKEDLDPNGSLTKNLQGIALKGDMPDGMARLQVYGETDEGKRGFWYLEDFDPASEAGAAVGDSSSQSEDADNTERKRGSREPFSLPVVTRIAIVEDKNLSEFVHVYFFMRYVSFTGFGRACGISRETRIPLGMINLSGGGDGGGTPDDISLEIVETPNASSDGETRQLQIKDFDEPSEEELPGGTLLDLLGLPINSSADTSVSGSTAPVYSFLAKMTSASSSSSGSSATSANSLEYVPRGGRVNTRPFALNGEQLCNVVADGDDTDVEIVVPALAPVPESGITIQTVLDSEGYPVIMIGHSGGSSGGGSSWSGYHTTGSSADVIMCGLRYTDNQLQAKFCDEVWDNGLLVSRTFHNDWTVITTAVPESVCQCSSNANGTEQGGSSQS